MIQDDMIRAALDGAIRDEPPCAAGLDEVLARARRMQVRQRIGAGVAGVSVTGLALTLAVAGAGGGGGGGSTDDLAAPPPVSPTATTSAAGGAAVTAPGRMLETLKRLVPPGFSVSQPTAQEGHAGVVLADADGKGQVSVNVQPAFGVVSGDPRVAASAEAHGKTTEVPSFFTCAGRDILWPATTCQDERLPDGTRIVTTQGPAGPGRAYGALTVEADVLTPDGVRVVAVAANRVDGVPGGPTRPWPPLTADQVRAIATSPAWRG